MFYEWVSEGAAFGIKAFFALVMFALCAGAVLLILVLVGSVMKEVKDGKKHRPF